MLHAKKSLGQNFLVNQGVVERIADAAGLTRDDTVLEVGPGTGTLTRALAARAGRVIAVEKDQRLIAELRASLPDNVEVVEGDALTFDPAAHGLRAGEYAVVANIPYYITSHLIRTALESWPRPSLLVLTVQREVADRMAATPPHMNLLALSVQLVADVRTVMRVSRGSFRPVPDVDSTVVAITPHRNPPEDTRAVLALGRAAFAAKRKQLANSLIGHLGNTREDVAEHIERVGIDPSTRPERLTIQQWFALTRKSP